MTDFDANIQHLNPLEWMFCGDFTSYELPRQSSNDPGDIETPAVSHLPEIINRDYPGLTCPRPAIQADLSCEAISRLVCQNHTE